MKKLFMFLAAALAIAGCEKNPAPDVEPGGDGKAQITLAIDEQTRTYFEEMGGSYRHSWEADDAVSVFLKSKTNAKFTLVEGADSSSAVFEGEATEGELENTYVVYPYNSATLLSGSTLYVEYPAVQTAPADKASYDSKAHLMVGCDTGKELNLKNISAFLKISLTGQTTIKSIVVESLGGEKLAGSFNANFEGGEPKVTSTIYGESAVTLNCDAELSDQATDFFIAVAPAALAEGFSVKITDAAGESVVKKHSEAVTLARNTVYELPAFEFGGAIDDWTLLGTGKYREDFFVGLWEDDETVEVDVEIYESASEKGTYLIKNMFEKALEEFFGASLKDIEDVMEFYKYTPTDIIITTNPATGAVTIDEQLTGIFDLDDTVYSGGACFYGDYTISSLSNGKITDGVITFPAKGLLMGTADGSYYYANTNGKFRICLPGAEAPEDFPIDLSLTFDLASNLFVSGSDSTLGFILQSATIDDIVSIKTLVAPTDTVKSMGGPSIALNESYGTDHTQYIANIKQNGYLGMSYNGIDANVEYICCVLAENKAGDKLLVWDTAKIPDGNTGGSGSLGVLADGSGGGNQGGGDIEGDNNGVALVTGTYNISDLVSTNSGDKEYGEDFTVIPDPDQNDGIHFLVDGIAGMSMCDWYAVYSASAGTLTLNGIQKGYEQYGNSFGEALADAGQYYAGVYSYTNYGVGAGKDNCVLTVDTKTGQLNGMRTYLALNAIDKSTGAVLGFFELLTPTSKITFVSAEVAASAKAASVGASPKQRTALKSAAKDLQSCQSLNGAKKQLDCKQANTTPETKKLAPRNTKRRAVQAVARIN